MNVRFPERNPLPDFLIVLAKASFQLSVGDLSGKVENITPDQGVLGKPLTFEFSGEKLEGVQAILAKGNLNHIDPSHPNDRVNFQAKGYNIQKVSLSLQPSWPVNLTKGKADVTVRAGLQGNTLKPRPEVITPLRGTGVNVRFPERNPLPDFLIVLAKASFQLSVGDLSGKVENITPDQGVLGKPLTFEFSGEKLEGVQAILAKGNLNHIDPSHPNDRVNFQAKGYNIQKVSLSLQPSWPVNLSKGPQFQFAWPAGPQNQTIWFQKSQ